MKIKIIGKYAIRDAKGVFRYPGEELEAPGDLALHDAERHVAGGRAELILKDEHRTSNIQRPTSNEDKSATKKAAKKRRSGSVKTKDTSPGQEGKDAETENSQD